MSHPFRPSSKSPFRPALEQAEFEKLVEEALAEIPASFRRMIENLAVMVEDEPPAGRSILGLYHGVPLDHRSPSGYGNTSPDVIIIYRKPIEEMSRTPEEIKIQVKLTVLHEVGHYFGLGERELRDIEDELMSSGKGRKG